MMIRLRLLLHGFVSILVFGLVGPGSALAHDVWLSVSADEIGVGGLVQVELWQGHARSPEPLARNARKLERLQAIGPNDHVVDLPGLHGRRPAGVFRATVPGTWRVLYEGRPSLHRLAAESFERYLEEEGLEHVLVERRTSSSQHEEGRELVSRSLKALVPVSPVAKLVDRPVGLPVELVLEEQGPPIELRLLVDGEPAEGVLVDLQTIDPAGPRFAARTAAGGVASFRIESPSEGRSSEGRLWMAAAVVARPSSSPEAAWRTHFATLVFPAQASEQAYPEPDGIEVR